MANWVSMKLAAEKYGISEERILEWIRLSYLTYSSLDKEPYDDTNPMVDTEELDKALVFNSIKSYPDDETVERLPIEHVNWLYQENARLEKFNDDLLEQNYVHTQREEKLIADLEKMTNLANEVLLLHAKVVDNYKSRISEKESIWAFLCSLFTWKKNKCLI
ncbi:hypothetical protein [Bacteroides stercorirosoris]|jgi:hypothetical protein|uniref:Uncharacterized protein n=1 Tax=Bacteroides stercorirosoris TaxID=871324 RepID=A0A413H3K6_9BACE|nr:hypothetical protein [Bacteroides stercorirosoris]RGX78101.1 hypothetical protein DXA68_12685 [Bacteroides stercorirosoris]